MGPFLSVIIAAILATLALDLNPAPDHVDRATPTAVAVAMVAAAWITSRVHRSRGAPPMSQPRWARVADLAFYGLLLFGTHWTTVAREATGDLPLIRQLMLLAPYVFAALARVDAAWPADHPDDHPWSRSRGVTFHARLLLIPIAPLLLVNGIHDVLERVEPVKALLERNPAFEYAVICALLVLATLAMPAILTWVLKSRRLPPGSLRTALEADLARQGVRVGGIEAVDTGGLVANAAYLGLTLRTSRIFISDGLLLAMPEDEIRAVFAHEVAHGTRRHLAWLMALLVAILLSTYVVADSFAEDWLAFGIAGFSMLFGIACFVPISRRFEVEADLVAGDTIGDPELFNRALLRVGAIAGKPLDRHGIRHFSIGYRTQIVRACAANPLVRGQWRRKLQSTKIAITAALVLMVAGAVWKAPYDVSGAALDVMAAQSRRQKHDDLRREGATSAEENAAVEAFVRDRYQAAIVRARKGLFHPATRREAAIIGIAASNGMADEALAHGDFDEARRIAADIEAHWPSGDKTGDFNRKMLRAELAAIDPSRDLASVRPEVTAALEGYKELMKTRAPDWSSDLVGRELSFLAAAVEGSSLGYDPESFESSRVLALVRGVEVPGPEPREVALKRALATWQVNDSAWRRKVLERALGKQPHEILLVAAETRRGA
jgi:Zn-dependent protease with chaperone function